MGRQKIHTYEQSVFAKRISLLQKQHGYTNDYIIDNLKDNKGNCLISDSQTYGNYKSGKRLPRDFPEIIAAFSRFYDVTAGYLIGTEDTPNHQIKSIQDATGLSEASAKKLADVRKNSPGIIKVIDSIIPALNEENILHCFYFFHQMGQIYKNLEVTETDLEITSTRLDKIGTGSAMSKSIGGTAGMGMAKGMTIGSIIPSILTFILLIISLIKVACQLLLLNSQKKNRNERQKKEHQTDNDI